MKSPVRANGGVVWREEAGLVEILIVHRPRYDDWSLPKGRLEEAETDEACALREVQEETGIRCSLGRELDGADYLDGEGRLKTVRYWAMRVVGGEFAANEEVNAVRWVSASEAQGLLSYEMDRKVVAAFFAMPDARQ